MGYTLAVFRARTQTILFANLLKSYNIPIIILDTPRDLNISCGISVKFDTINKETAELLIKRRRFDSFAGFFDY
ncbi:MAG: DUF3343 domain-containing protein [Clostridia bacterium]|nr:DUF3343 domain-containing protein [Clostridia bacterium]